MSSAVSTGRDRSEAVFRGAASSFGTGLASGSSVHDSAAPTIGGVLTGFPGAGPR